MLTLYKLRKSWQKPLLLHLCLVHTLWVTKLDDHVSYTSQIIRHCNTDTHSPPCLAGSNLRQRRRSSCWSVSSWRQTQSGVVVCARPRDSPCSLNVTSSTHSSRSSLSPPDKKNTHFRNIIYSLNDKFGMIFNFLFLKKNISILFCKFLLSNIAANYVT